MIPKIRHLPMNEELRGQAEVIRHIVYSENGQDLTLIAPWKGRDLPLIIFIQGSSWNTPNKDFEIPMLSHFAEEGIAVASVGHRSAADGHPMPAFLQDVKCAVRYMRANSERYSIAPDRIAAFGTSSGGNAACLLGLTGDDPRFRTDEYPNESDAVCGVVSCFGPTDLPALFRWHSQFGDMRKAYAAYFGPIPEKWSDVMRLCSPVEHVKPGRSYPPFLLLNGTGDAVVPHDQMEALYTRLQEAGADVRAYYVDRAEHEGNFWGPQVRQLIHETLRSWLAAT